MEFTEICKSSKNLTVEDSISNIQYTQIRNNLSQNENRDDKNILNSDQSTIKFLRIILNSISIM